MDNQPESKQSLFVGEGVTLEGKVNTTGAVEVHGVVIGDVVAHSVQIGAGGKVEGSITSSTLDISGSVSSDVNIEGRLVLRARGVVKGNVNYGSLQVDAGARVFGSLRQIEPPESKKDAPELLQDQTEVESSGDEESTSV